MSMRILLITMRTATSATRRSTSQKLRSLPLPEAFATATAASAARETYRRTPNRADARRASRKVSALVSRGAL